MERSELTKAEQLWKWGVYATNADPYVELMRVLQRLEDVKGVRVKNFTLHRIPIYGTRRLVATLDMQEIGKGAFGVGLKWQGQKWKLQIDDAWIPSYVRETLDKVADQRN
jgi:hypothetical protein